MKEIVTTRKAFGCIECYRRLTEDAIKQGKMKDAEIYLSLQRVYERAMSDREDGKSFVTLKEKDFEIIKEAGEYFSQV